MEGYDDGLLSNGEILDRLFADGLIRLQRGPIFGETPTPLPPTVRFDRAEGLLLGLAVGDGLGNTTEGQLPHLRRQGHGEIRNYLPNRYAGGRAVGLPSDDTQMAFWLLEQTLDEGRLRPSRLAEVYTTRQIFGIGGIVSQFRTNIRDRGMPWYKAGVTVDAAGNGALMRIAPVVLPYLHQASPAMYADAALAAMLTHNDPASTSICVAWAAMLWDLLGMDKPPSPEWWVHRYIEVARPLEGDATRHTPRSPALANQYSGPVWRFVEKYVLEAWQAQRSVLDACNDWYSGAYLLETWPSVLYLLMRHADDPAEAIVRAVNDTKDNDTVAAIVGAAVGALHGADALPARWRAHLLGRTGTDDDGQVFALIEQARVRWFDGD
jgi:ADP-ribosylglycohydrolase